MTGLNKEQLEFVTDREDTAAQWERMRPLFDGFYGFLKKRGLKPRTISKKINSTVVFIVNHLFTKGISHKIDGATPDNLTYFLEGCMGEAIPDDKPSRKRTFKKALVDFYTYLHQEGLVEREYVNLIASAPIQFDLNGPVRPTHEKSGNASQPALALPAPTGSDSPGAKKQPPA